MNEKPLVSVLTPTYNAEKFIAAAIESVLQSSYTNFELIICDDCSTDTTVAIVQKYKQQDSRIKVYINEQNLGDYPNRNKTASYAQGTYLKYLDHDDTIYPWGLEAMVYCMECHPQAAYGLISVITTITNLKYPLAISPLEAYKTFFFKDGLFGVGPTGAIIKREVFVGAGGFSGKPFVGDVEMWLKLSRSLEMVLMPADLIWYRNHDDQESNKEYKDVNFELRRSRVIRDALIHPLCPLPKNISTIALRNHINVLTRKLLLRHWKPSEWSRLRSEFKKHELQMLDIIKAMKKNCTPDFL